MALKPIVTIDVDDARFKQFTALFEKYQEALKKLPQQQRAAGAAASQLTDANQGLVAAMLTQNQLMTQMLSSQRGIATQANSMAGAWRQVSQHAQTVSANVNSATRQLLRLTGISTIFSGLLGAGSLWGFNHLAGDVAGMRQSAAGLGITPGQQTATGLAFGRFLGSPGSALSSVAAALVDPTNPAYRPLAALLGNVQGQNASDVLSRLLQRLPQVFPGGANQANLGALANAYGLTNIMPVEDIRRYLSASPDERRRQERMFREGSSSFDLDPRLTRVYQDFTTQIEAAGNTLFNVFVRGLEPLTQPLADLSKGVVTLVETFMGAAKEKHWIENLSKGLEDVSKAIKDGSLSETIKSFVDGIDQMTIKLQYIASWLPGPDTGSGLVKSFLGPQQDIDAVMAAYRALKNIATPWAPGAAGSGAAGPNIGSPGTGLTTVTTRGGVKVTVASRYAARFAGFLGDLEAAGAPIHDAGGYNLRTIAGTHILSRHAFGEAIDIDQRGRDRVSPEFRAWAQTHLRELRAAEMKYGMKSGGDWSNPDFGHWEVKRGAPGVNIRIENPAGANVITSSAAIAGAGSPL